MFSGLSLRITIMLIIEKYMKTLIIPYIDKWFYIYYFNLPQSWPKKEHVLLLLFPLICRRADWVPERFPELPGIRSWHGSCDPSTGLPLPYELLKMQKATVVWSWERILNKSFSLGKNKTLHFYMLRLDFFSHWVWGPRWDGTVTFVTSQQTNAKWCIHMRTYCATITKRWSSGTCHRVEPWEQDATWKEPVMEGYKLYDSTFMKSPKQTNP